MVKMEELATNRPTGIMRGIEKSNRSRDVHQRPVLALSNHNKDILQMTNAVFTSLSMFYLCTFLIPKTVIKQIDKYRKHGLWRGCDINAKNPSKAAWEMVCVLKGEGGLGVLNLQTQNEALLLFAQVL